MRGQRPTAGRALGLVLASLTMLTLLAIWTPAGFGDPGPFSCDPAAAVANLSLGQSVALSGANVTVTYTVSNFGPCSADDATITVVLPTGYTFVSASGLKGSWSASVSGNTVTLTDGASIAQPAGSGKPGVASVALTAAAPSGSTNDTFDAVVTSLESDPDCSGVCFGSGSDNEIFGGYSASIQTGAATGLGQTTSVNRPSAASVSIQQLDPGIVSGNPCSPNPCLDNSKLIFITTPSTGSIKTPLVFVFIIPNATKGQAVTVLHLVDGTTTWVNVASCQGTKVDPCVNSIKFTGYSSSHTSPSTNGYFTVTVLSSSNGGWGNR